MSAVRLQGERAGVGAPVTRLTPDEFLARERVAMFATPDARDIFAAFGDASAVVATVLLVASEDDMDAFCRASPEARFDVLAERLGSPEEVARRLAATMVGDLADEVRRGAYMDAAEFAAFRSGWEKDSAMVAARVWEELFGDE